MATFSAAAAGAALAGAWLAAAAVPPLPELAREPLNRGGALVAVVAVIRLLEPGHVLTRGEWRIGRLGLLVGLGFWLALVQAGWIAAHEGLALDVSASVFLLAVLYHAVSQGLNVAFEEVICRGYLLQALWTRFGAWRAVGVSSLVFALAHAPAEGLAPLRMLELILAGMFLGWTYIRLGGLWAPLALHWGINLGASVGSLLLPSSGPAGQGTTDASYALSISLYAAGLCLVYLRNGLAPRTTRSEP